MSVLTIIGLLILLLLIFSPLLIWDQTMKIRQDNQASASAICDRLDALIKVNGGTLPTDKPTFVETLITPPKKPHTTQASGGYSSLSKKGWNR